MYTPSNCISARNSDFYLKNTGAKYEMPALIRKKCSYFAVYLFLLVTFSNMLALSSTIILVGGLGRGVRLQAESWCPLDSIQSVSLN